MDVYKLKQYNVEIFSLKRNQSIVNEFFISENSLGLLGITKVRYYYIIIVTTVALQGRKGHRKFNTGLYLAREIFRVDLFIIVHPVPRWVRGEWGKSLTNVHQRWTDVW